jgi:hypothetical protein
LGKPMNLLYSVDLSWSRITLGWLVPVKNSYPFHICIFAAFLTLSYSSAGSPARARALCLGLIISKVSWANYIYLTTSFLYLVVTLALKKKLRSNIRLEIRPQSAFTASFCPPVRCSLYCWVI